MVSDANRPGLEVGGHIATYQSAASLYEVGFNHFFRGKEHPGGGDQVYIQGHGSPGIYARAYLEGRLTEDQLRRFRQEVQHGVGKGLPSYPHPRLMPEFWEFPTVSMGLTAIGSIYQARFNRYLQNRGIKDTSEQHVWAFLGDGEMAEPESLGAIGVAAREELDNLTWVINCNLQQLDGPVRGNGKIIQELEAQFRGAGWNVVKVIWGREWDALLARDVDGVLVNQMNSTPDGQFQTYSVEDGAYNREKFFGADPRLRKMVEHMTDRQIEKLPRGGHDYRKVYAAFDAAAKHVGQPTVILAHTVKGWTIESLEGRNATHQMKKLKTGDFKKFRDRLYLPMSDKDIDDTYEANGGAPFFHPGPDSPEIEYMMERRKQLGGPLPKRVVRAKPVEVPDPELYDELKQGSGKSKIATTMAVVRLLRDWMKDKEIGPRIVPIAPDEYRTFGMDSMFPSAKVYNPGGQRYESVDRKLLLKWREATDGQLLHEGISEAGAMASAIAAGSSYATHGQVMIPFYIFYSMFGFQRTGDSIWAMADQLARGFLIGATAGRTTLTGEGLQHADGHSPLLAATNPAVVHYDPAFAHEVAHIMEDGLRRMYTVSDEHPHGEDVIFYITVYNEPMVQPKEPDNIDKEGLLKGIYHYADAPEVSGNGDAPRIQLFASGVGFPWIQKAQKLLADDWGVAADLWSVTSWNELARDAIEAEKWTLNHPGEKAKVPFITSRLEDVTGPVVAVSDYMRAVPLQIAHWMPTDYHVLGTDGFGFADTRPAARRFFQVDAESVVVAALRALADRGEVKAEVVAEAFAEVPHRRPHRGGRRQAGRWRRLIPHQIAPFAPDSAGTPNEPHRVDGRTPAREHPPGPRDRLLCPRVARDRGSRRAVQGCRRDPGRARADHHHRHGAHAHGRGEADRLPPRETSVTRRRGAVAAPPAGAVPRPPRRGSRAPAARC